MKTKLFLIGLLCFSLFSMNATAQEDKEVIFIDYFYKASDVPFGNSEAIRNKVIESLHNIGRFKIVDVDSQAALRVEKDRREDPSAMGDATARTGEMKSLGANYVISGDVTAVTPMKNRSKEGNVYYTATISFSLKVFDVATGTIKASDTFSFSNDLGGILVTGSDNPDKAIATAIDKINLKKFVDANFQLEGTIVQIEVVKKGKAEEVYIDLGSNRGVKAKNRFDVCRETMIAGELATKKIGELVAKEVVSGKRTLCKVTDGGVEIKDASDKGEKLIIVLTKTGGGGGFKAADLLK